MIITDKFVFIHDPKTGGSFITSALMQLYDVRWGNLDHLKLIFLGQISYQTRFGELIHTNKKHFGCHHIPAEHADKNILTTVRNPYDWYVSQYEFGWWKHKSMFKYYKNIADFKEKYPSFPNLTFSEFISLANEAFDTNFDCAPETWAQYGWRTRSFLNFYFKNPTEGMLKIEKNSDSQVENIKEGLFNKLYFIKTHNLNKEFYDFLLEMDYPVESIDFILKKEKVLPLGKGRTKNQKWQQYFTPQLKETIRDKDRYLFELFPEFDI